MTDLDPDRIMAEHQRAANVPEWCDECLVQWPCLPYRLAAEVARLNAAGCDLSFDHAVLQTMAEGMQNRIDRLAAENAALRAAIGRVEALFSGGPDTSCRTTWRESDMPLLSPEVTECVEVPTEDLRDALPALRYRAIPDWERWMLTGDREAYKREFGEYPPARPKGEQ